MTTGSVHVTLNEESANVEGVAALVKAFLNSEEEYSICDVNGFTISDCPGTRGKLSDSLSIILLNFLVRYNKPNDS